MFESTSVSAKTAKEAEFNFFNKKIELQFKKNHFKNKQKAREQDDAIRNGLLSILLKTLQASKTACWNLACCTTVDGKSNIKSACLTAT